MIRNKIFLLNSKDIIKDVFLLYEVTEINLLVLKTVGNDEFLFVTTDRDWIYIFSIRNLKNGITKPLTVLEAKSEIDLMFISHGIWSLDFNPITKDLYIGSNKRRVDVK